MGRPQGPDLSLQTASPLSLKTLPGAASLWPSRNTHCSSHPCPPVLPGCHPQPRAISKPNQFPFSTETIVQALSPVVSRTPGQRRRGLQCKLDAVAFEERLGTVRTCCRLEGSVRSFLVLSSLWELGPWAEILASFFFLILSFGPCPLILHPIALCSLSTVGWPHFSSYTHSVRHIESRHVES